MDEHNKVFINMMVDALVEALTTDQPEYLHNDLVEIHDKVDPVEQKNPNWQANVARQISSRLLYVSNADGMGGCSLCQG